MTRPRQEPTLTIFHKKTHAPIDVLTHEVMFTITYDGKLMNIRETKRNPQGVIYVKHLYNMAGNKASTETQCRKLNEKFKTDKFAVKEIRI